MPLQFESENVQDYFVNVGNLQERFRALLTAPTLPKPLYVIHGVGGVGKSTQLRMFRLQCKKMHIPVALASGSEARSTVGILTYWSDDLKKNGVKLLTFSKTFKQYLAIQAKVEEKAQEKHARFSDLVGKASSKTTDVTTGAAVGTAIGSVIPGISTLGSALGGMAAELLGDSLREFLTKSEIDLLLDPGRALTNDFLGDISQVASKKRVVLMLDNYEQVSALDDWACELALKLPPNIFWIIAGRTIPNWVRKWPRGLELAQVEELKPMSDENIRTLVRRYYAMSHGGELDPVQVDAIAKFSRGLPMAVTTAVGLWTKYGVEDFEVIETEIVSNLVDRLLDDVSQEMRPALEASSMLPWFDKESLRAVTGLNDVDQIYDNLRRYPFVRAQAEGLVVHESVQEMIKKYVRLNAQPQEYQALLERAIAYFRAAIAKLEEYKGTFGLSGEIDAREKTLRDALGDAVFELGFLFSKQDRWYDALRLLEESLAIRRQNDNLGTRAETIYQIARIHHLMGNLERARIHYRDALRLYIHLRNQRGIAACKTGLGRLMIQLGFLDEALNELEQVKQIYLKLSDHRRITEIEEVLQVANHIKERQSK